MQVQSDDTPVLVLLPGMAADKRIFSTQLTSFPNLVVPGWIQPQPDESLTGYAKRLAATLPADRPLVIGGASFGGMVATEVAKHVDPVALVLIGSVKSPNDLPRWIRTLRPLATITPAFVVKLLQAAASVAARCVKPFVRRSTAGVLDQVQRSDHRVLHWSLRAITRWRDPPCIECPIFHIHGAADRILPAKKAGPDRIIDGAGHFLSMTHGDEVNDFLRQVIKATS